MEKLRHFFSRLSDGIDRFIRVCAMAFLVVMVMVIFIQVIARYVFFSPPAWTEEVARYAMVWVGLLGASISFKAGFDPGLVKISPDMPRKKRLSMASVRAMSVVLFFAPILWYCFFGPNMSVARSFLSRSLQTSAETFKVSMIFAAISVPIFIIAIFIHGISKALNEIAR